MDRLTTFACNSVAVSVEFRAIAGIAGVQRRDTSGACSRAVRVVSRLGRGWLLWCRGEKLCALLLDCVWCICTDVGVGFRLLDWFLRSVGWFNRWGARRCGCHSRGSCGCNRGGSGSCGDGDRFGLDDGFSIGTTAATGQSDDDEQSCADASPFQAATAFLLAG